MNPELEWWEGDGGTEYTKRNPSTWVNRTQRSKSLLRALDHIAGEPRTRTILEVGCGSGANLMALRHAGFPKSALYGIEPNPLARAEAIESGAATAVYDGHASAIPAADSTFDLVMTAGVLIHVHPERLPFAMKEIIRVSKAYVLAIEYFAVEPEPIVYYGAERIWRNDFGKLYLDLGLKVIDTGFFWKHEPSGYDSTVYWLLQKGGE